MSNLMDILNSMTHQFYCHYTGKDGITPRRRLQTLTFFNHVPAVNNSTSSPTPLWVEVFTVNDASYYYIHAQLSDNVAVYTEEATSKHLCSLMNDYDNGIMNYHILRTATPETIELFRQLTDFTSYLLSNPDRITPPVLAAYKEARPEEYQKLQSLYIY